MITPPKPPRSGAVALAFAVVYVSWSTTYLAIRIGVHDERLPPSLFGGTRVCLAGIFLLLGLRLRGVSWHIPRRELAWVVLSGLLLFVGGNGLITLAEKSLESGVAAVLVATTPLWLAIFETLWPGGDRLLPRGWLGLGIGMAGVVLLKPAEFTRSWGPVLVLGSAACWSLGSLVIRYHRPSGSHLVAAAIQMIAGGGCLALVGVAVGEVGQLPGTITPRAWAAFFWLLVIGSLLGFVAFNWLLGHVSATLVGTYAYVNPVIAVAIGWLFADEVIEARMVGGMVVILAAVALVRGATHKPARSLPEKKTLATGLTGYWNNPTSGQESRTD